MCIRDSKETFQDQQDLTLLKQALAGGQISMIEYFVEDVYKRQAYRPTPRGLSSSTDICKPPLRIYGQWETSEDVYKRQV